MRLRDPCPTWWLLPLAILLMVAAFPPLGLWPCAGVMLAPLALLAERAGPGRVFVFAHLSSAAAGLWLVRWLARALAVELEVPRPAAWGFTGLLVGTAALVPAAAAALYAGLRPRVGLASAPLLFAALWTLGEWLRAVPLALPWLLAGQPLAFVPGAIQTADLVGVHGLGLGVAALGGGVGIALAQRRLQPLIAPLLLLLLAGLYGSWRLAEPPATGPPVAVGVVQASVPLDERFRQGSALPNTRRHLRLGRELLEAGPLDLLVWPETAVDAQLDRAPRLEALIRAQVDRSRVPLVTGAPLANDGRPTNSVLLFAPEQGRVGAYHKQRLVPLTEYDPPLPGWTTRLLGPLAEGDPYVPGAGPVLLSLPGLSVGTPVCFEITYPDLVRDLVSAGADLLINLSNDAWFGRSGYAEMHLAHAVLRAVELRTWVVRAANTGISAAVDPQGRVVERLPVFEAGVLRAEVRPREAPSVYARYGDLPLLAALALLPVGCLVLGRPRGRRPPASRGPSGDRNPRV